MLLRICMQVGAICAPVLHLLLHLPQRPLQLRVALLQASHLLLRLLPACLLLLLAPHDKIRCNLGTIMAQQQLQGSSQLAQ